VLDALLQGTNRQEQIMPAYKSHFESAKTAAKQWRLKDAEAKTACETLELLELELAHGAYADARVTEATDFFLQKTNVDPSQKLKTTTAPIDNEQFTKLLLHYRGMLVMRLLSSGSLQARTDYRLIWGPLKGRMKGNEVYAMTLAALFNNTYLVDEQMNYLQYLTKVKKNPMEVKPWVVRKPGDITLQVWHKA
jgi:hypothetical protein